MNYKLINGSLNDINNPKETILLNRGIKNYKEYLNLTDDCLYHWSLLDNMKEAVQCLLKHIENGDEIHVIPDTDVDGQCSAAILYRYLKIFDLSINLSYSIHTGKQHGLSKDIVIPENVKLIIIPDAGSNDIEQCKTLKDKGINIIILDHHLINNDQIYSNAIIVNNQIGDYPNKNLSGVGVVYRFLQAIDEITWNEYANQFLDLVALGNIGDAMDIRSFETKRLIDKGLSKIRSKFLKALIEKQSYSMCNDITINNIQFYVVPLINGMIRNGDYDEKELMFRAFIETDETFKYKPRHKSKDDPEPEEIDEDIYTRVVRLCVNAKARQNRANEEDLNEITEYIREKGFDKNKIVIANITGKLDENATGLSAMKLADKFGKPCLLLRKTKENENIYAGSGRNINNSPISSLKDFLDGIGKFEYINGHDNAFGCAIKKENIKDVIDLINQKLNKVDFTKYFEVDFIIEAENLDIRFIKEINDLKDIWGQRIDESKVVIKNLVINKNDIQLMGKAKDTWSYIWNDEIKFIKFKNDKNDLVVKWLSSWDDEEENIVVNAIGKCGLNGFGGILSPQVIILDYERVN